MPSCLCGFVCDIGLGCAGLAGLGGWQLACLLVWAGLALAGVGPGLAGLAGWPAGLGCAVQCWVGLSGLVWSGLACSFLPACQSVRLFVRMLASWPACLPACLAAHACAP